MNLLNKVAIKSRSTTKEECKDYREFLVKADELKALIENKTGCKAKVNISQPDGYGLLDLDAEISWDGILWVCIDGILAENVSGSFNLVMERLITATDLDAYRTAEYSQLVAKIITDNPMGSYLHVSHGELLYNDQYDEDQLICLLDEITGFEVTCDDYSKFSEVIIKTKDRIYKIQTAVAELCEYEIEWNSSPMLPASNALSEPKVKASAQAGVLCGNNLFDNDLPF